ncbi:hypothetical protein [Streptomyces sp. HUAS TT20]|uniref:hypothetical protein n=1 Tax=Streptomyces sp. HUAS TT20 TaxID=3447509 RepID=UPI0021D833F4|nr:hypothetical protein [Streptomyces sp. HUAS 15-9]UXY29174.1 hypothetical protein N8I87_23210 [Streptomyces sp. HUAS 15-9]
MAATDGGDAAAELKKRAERLRECAREAPSIARRLGPYLDEFVIGDEERPAALGT